MTPLIDPEAEAKLDRRALTEALAAGRALPRAEPKDSFLYRGDDTVLSRAAWIGCLGTAVKTVTIFPGNAAPGKPALGSAVAVFDEAGGSRAASAHAPGDITVFKNGGGAHLDLMTARHILDAVAA